MKKILIVIIFSFLIIINTVFAFITNFSFNNQQDKDLIANAEEYETNPSSNTQEEKKSNTEQNKKPQKPEHNKKLPKLNHDRKPPVIEDLKPQAKAEFLIEPSSGYIMYEYNADTKLPIASMVKLMTTLLIFEDIDKGNINFDDKIVVSESASGMGGSQMFLDANTPYAVRDLLKGVIVASANDACVAFAEKIAGSEQDFVNMMNKRAAELGMTNTNYVNCTGLPGDGQYSTARDVAKVTSEVIKHKDYYSFCEIWLEDFVHPSGRVTQLANTNKLIRHYQGCDSGKTGFTDDALFCLSASAKRNDLRVIAVVIGGQSSKLRFFEVSKLFNYAFGSFINEIALRANEPLEQTLTVNSGEKETIKIGAEKDLNILMRKVDKKNFELTIELIENIKAPVKKDDIVGKASILINNQIVNSCNIIALEDCNTARYGHYINKIIDKW